MDQPLRVAWQTLLQNPVLIVIPIAWDALVWLLTLASGIGFHASSPGDFRIKAVLPGTLPSGFDLLGLRPSMSFSGNVEATGILVNLLLAVGSAMVTAGFLHLLAGALSDIAPTWDRFVEGVNRYTWRLLLWNLITLAVGLVVVSATMAIAPLGLMLGLVAFVAMVAFVLVPFLVVQEDLPLGDAVAMAPERLRTNFSLLLMVVVATLGTSIALSAVLSGLAIAGVAVQLALAIGLWSWFGTWTTLAVLAAINPTYVES